MVMPVVLVFSITAAIPSWASNGRLEAVRTLGGLLFAGTEQRFG